MSTTSDSRERSAERAARIFGRVLVGVDGSEAGLEAARQAARLAEGPLTLVSVVGTLPPAAAGPIGVGPVLYAEEDRSDEAEAALAEALQEVEDLHAAAGTVARGVPWDELLNGAEAAGATLVAVGSHGTGRRAGIVFGSTATAVIHKAKCSVLVARGTQPKEFPQRIVVGVDGSSESELALEVARYVAARHGASVWPLAAHGGDGIDRERVAELLRDRYEHAPDDPVHALVAASAGSDLLVVGSRGLHGLKALGSVSERVAHRARCSVLVVRGL